MPRCLATCVLAVTVALTASWAAADEASYSLNVKRSRLLGSSAGTLEINAEGIAYLTKSTDEARLWAYPDIKQIQIRSPKRIVILTYEDQELKLGADRAFDFEVRGGTVRPEVVAFLLSKTDRPIATAVIPPLGPAPLARVRVKHERWGRGSDGELVLYDDALVYLTARETEARYWRLTDLFLALPVDPFHYQVLAYEGGAGRLRPFTFELKAPWPAAYAHDLRVRGSRPSPVMTAQSTPPVQ